MGLLHATIIDAASGEKIDAKVHVLNSMAFIGRPPELHWLPCITCIL